jgi:hypothetical protein
MSPGWWFDRAEGVGVGVVVSCVQFICSFTPTRLCLFFKHVPSLNLPFFSHCMSQRHISYISKDLSDGGGKPPPIKRNWKSMVTAPGQFPRRSVPHFASMLIEDFSYVQFVPLTPKYMRHKLHLGKRLYFSLSSVGSVVRCPLSVVRRPSSVPIDFPRKD